MLFKKPSTDNAVTMTARQARQALLNGKTLRLVDIPGQPEEKVRPYRGQWPLIVKLEELDESDGIAVVCEDNPRAAWYLDPSTELQVVE